MTNWATELRYLEEDAREMLEDDIRAFGPMCFICGEHIPDAEPVEVTIDPGEADQGDVPVCGDCAVLLGGTAYKAQNAQKGEK